MIVECAKFVVSFVMLSREAGVASALERIAVLRPSGIVIYAPPAILYVINNNLVFYMLTMLDPTSFQVINNLKIITTAILFRVVFKKYLSGVKWSALLLLALGATLSQLKSKCDCGEAVSGGLTFLGLFIGILQSIFSGIAGVYTEFVMKYKEKQSIHLQNMQLYLFGAAINFVVLLWTTREQPTSQPSAVGATGAAVATEPVSFAGTVFEGWSIYVILVLLVQTFNGISVSYIMKFANNIVKVYISSTAMVLTSVVSVGLFGIVPDVHLIMGMVVVIISIYLYNVTPAPAPAPLQLPTKTET